MTFIADKHRLGILPQAQYGKSRTGAEYDPDLRNSLYAIRVKIGADGSPEAEGETYGPIKNGILWPSPNNQRFSRHWGYGFPATQESLGVQASTGLPLGGGPRNLFPVSAYADARNTPTKFRTTGNGAWGDIEQRLMRLNPAVPFAVPYPNGWPFIVQSGLNMDEQAELALPGFVGLVAPSFVERPEAGAPTGPTSGVGISGGAGIFGLPGAGAPNPLAGSPGGSAGIFGLPGGAGRGQATPPEVEALGTRVFDPALTGDLEGSQYALLHSLFKLYRLPDSKCFDFRGKKPLAPLGIALRLGPTKEGMAGHGVIYDGPEGSGDFGVLSWRGGGPIRPVPELYEYDNAANSSAQGRIGPAALSTRSLFDFHDSPRGAAGGSKFAGPINFRNMPLPRAFQAPLFTQAFIGIEQDIATVDRCGNLHEGVWDVRSTSFFSVVEEDGDPPPPGGEPALGGGDIFQASGQPKRPEGLASKSIFLPVPVTGRPLVASVNEIGLPGLVFRAQAWSQGAPDLRNILGDDFQSNPRAQRMWQSSAAVLRMDVIAAQNGDAQVETTAAGRDSRYMGMPTSSGSAWFMPPEQGMETLTQNIPATQSTAMLGFHGVTQAFGTPDLSSGGYNTGFDIALNTDSTPFLSFSYTDDGGSKTADMAQVTTRGTIQTQAGYEITAYNGTGGAIADGKVVTVPSGGGVTGLMPNVDVVGATTDTPIGIVVGEIGDGESGTILTRGALDGITISGSPSEGDAVYFDASGDLTFTEPFAGATPIGQWWG